ncbi:MAG: GspH/FimT family pseudopilin [Nitrosomonadales bacterium]|nr:GspH/FimT family pseudopilin [Nitrosomonadales bacterium]
MQTKRRRVFGRAPERQTGVTMTELMIVVAIAGILAAITAPSFSSFINNTRLSTTMTQLSSDLNRARVDAIKRNSWMLICVRNAAGTNCGTGTDWKNGWLVCHASTSTATACDVATVADPNPIINQHQAINTKLTLIGSAALIRFNPNGTQGTGAAATLTLCCKSNSASTTSIASIAGTGNISIQ